MEPEPYEPFWRDHMYQHRGRSGGFLQDEGEGWEINVRMQREMTKQANLRARLRDLGFDVATINRCHVEAGRTPEDDVVTMPWSVIYAAFNRDDGFAMGASA